MKYMITGFLVLSLLFLIYTIPIFAAENDNPTESIIHTYKEDITGDSIKEVIDLYGVLFSKDSGYYHNTWTTINSLGKMHWKITYEGGYKPELQFIDLDHDGVKDVFYQSATGGSGRLYYYRLHTLKDKRVKELPLPKSSYIHGEFKDNFKAELRIEPRKKPIIIDIKDRSNDYNRLGIYDENGNLLKKTDLIIDPIAFFEPTLLSKSKGYGLRGYQQVRGAYRADQLGTIETFWYFEDGKWINLKTQWVPAGKKE